MILKISFSNKKTSAIYISANGYETASKVSVKLPIREIQVKIINYYILFLPKLRQYESASGQNLLSSDSASWKPKKRLVGVLLEQ